MKKTVIIGNLGQDAQIKTTQQGAQYLSFTVAVSEKRSGQETTTWFSCSGWGDRFVTGQLGQYLRKGTKVYIEGNYSPSLFQRQDGTTDISHNLMVNQLELLGSAPQATGQPAAAPAPAAPAAAPAAPTSWPAAQQGVPQNTSQKLAQQPDPWTPGSGHSDDMPF